MPQSCRPHLHVHSVNVYQPRRQLDLLCFGSTQQSFYGNIGYICGVSYVIQYSSLTLSSLMLFSFQKARDIILVKADMFLIGILVLAHNLF